MFDVGFSELVVIAIVALVVIGPERLPKVARTAGHLLGRLQRYVNDVKADINREMQLDELKKLQGELQDSASSFEQSIRGEIQSTQQLVDQTVQLDELKKLRSDLQDTASSFEHSVDSEIQTAQQLANQTIRVDEQRKLRSELQDTASNVEHSADSGIRADHPIADRRAQPVELTAVPPPVAADAPAVSGHKV